MTALESAYLVVGTDVAKIATVLTRIKKHFPDQAVETHIAADGSARVLVDSFQTLGLLAEQRLVIVTSVQDWKAEDARCIVAYLDDPSPDVVLLMVADKLDARKPLRKAFARPRLIECTGPDTPQLIREWVVGGFVAAGASGDRASVKRLIELCCGIDPNDARAVKELNGGDLARLRTDIERIASYAGSDPITVEMVDQLATRSSDEKVWVLGDAWARGDRSAFLSIVGQLLDQREHPVRLVGSLGRHLCQLHDAQGLLQAKGPDAATQDLKGQGVNPWVAKRIVQQAQRVKAGRLDSALTRIAQLDAELKGASILGGRIGEDTAAGTRVVLERGLFEIV